ncbi:hypothetical protein HanPI659440_Chr04g0173321 [Helianthus annuus]|nr:hypothetical protein HanPI659440_Chr04g0173321 [Helianthus annuus]
MVARLSLWSFFRRHGLGFQGSIFLCAFERHVLSKYGRTYVRSFVPHLILMVTTSKLMSKVLYVKLMHCIQ